MAERRNYIVYDTETSGLDPVNNEIIQFAAKALNAWDFSDHHAGSINLYIKPQHPETASAKAIEVVGPVWAKANDEGLSPKVAFRTALDWIESVNDGKKNSTKPIPVGQNEPFDRAFFEEAVIRKHKLIKSKDEMPFNGIAMDTWSMAVGFFESDPSMAFFNLDAILAKLGMQRKSDYHDAMEDVEATTNIFRRFMKFNRECRKRMRIE